jgi:hypothetical protein
MRGQTVAGIAEDRTNATPSLDCNGTRRLGVVWRNLSRRGHPPSLTVSASGEARAMPFLTVICHASWRVPEVYRDRPAGC